MSYNRALSELNQNLTALTNELHLIRKLLDKNGIFKDFGRGSLKKSFAQMEKEAKEVILPKSEREASESKTGEQLQQEFEKEQAEKREEAVEMLNFNPDNLEWETVPKRGTREAYERYPFQGHKAESKPDYLNLRKAIIASGKKRFNYNKYYYWVWQNDTSIISRRPSNY